MSDIGVHKQLLANTFAISSLYVSAESLPQGAKKINECNFKKLKHNMQDTGHASWSLMLNLIQTAITYLQNLFGTANSESRNIF